MATLKTISQINESGVLINGVIFLRKFGVEIEGSNITINTIDSAISRTFSGDIRNVEIDGQVYEDPVAAAKALEGYVNFNPGGGVSPQPTPTSGDYRVRFISPIPIDGKDEYVVSTIFVNKGESVTKLPDVPALESKFLIPDGWTHALEELADIQHDIDVGAQYKTVDGATYAFVNTNKAMGTTIPVYLSGVSGTVTLQVCRVGDDAIVNTYQFTADVAGTAIDTIDYGDYYFKITVSEGGSYSLGGDTSSTNFTGGSSTEARRQLLKCYVGDNVTIVRYAFYYNTAMKSVVLSRGIKLITYYSLNGCHSLRLLVIPNSVTDIQGSFLQNSRSIYAVVLPDSIVNISNGFNGCYSLRSVVLPKSTPSIYGLFQNCYTLERITLPRGVTVIDFYAFANCYALHGGVVIPDGVTRIGEYSFSGCSSLLSVDMPEGVTYIGQYSFQGCSSLQELVIRATVPPKLTANAVSTLNESAKWYVPDESLEAYKAATNWAAYANRFYPMSERPNN